MTESERHQKIESVLTRGVEDIFVKENLKERLFSGKNLRIKLGVDPTSKHLHIGRAIPLWKLRDFQDLGHIPVFIVGDFTAMIGDPSDKLSKRPMLNEKEIKENLATYKKQVGRIIDLKKAEFHYNSKWLKKLSFAEIATLAETFTVGQMIARRNFKDRFDKGDEISLREFLYPLMQGYDSVAIKADVELGGFDQLFNVKAGRTIQKYYGQKEQDVLTTQMLEGTDGRKMSSSWGNVIAIDDEPADMYGKVMSLRDDLIERYFILCTRLSEGEIENIIVPLKTGGNPKEIKMRLAKEIVSLYHGIKSAEKAEKLFIETFSEGKIPEDVPSIKLKREVLLADELLAAGMISSKSDWRRLILEGAVYDLSNNIKIDNPLYTPSRSMTLRIGKKRFVKIII